MQERGFLLSKWVGKAFTTRDAREFLNVHKRQCGLETITEQRN